MDHPPGPHGSLLGPGYFAWALASGSWDEGNQVPGQASREATHGNVRPGGVTPCKGNTSPGVLGKAGLSRRCSALSQRYPDAVPTIWSRLSRLVPARPAQSCSVSLGDRTLLRRCRAGQTDTGLVSVPRHVVRMSGVESRLRIQNVLARSHFFAIPILGNACSPRTRPVPLVRVKRARAAPTLLERHGRLEGVRLELRHL